MPDLTPELNLNLALDDDDTADYLTINLSDSLTVLDGLFNSSTGHAHNGSHQGGALEFLDLTVGEDLTVVGQTQLQGPLLAQSNMHVIGLSTLDGAVTMGSTLAVTGVTTLSAQLVCSANASVGTDLAVTRDLNVGRNGVVTGVLTVGGALNANGGGTLTGITHSGGALTGTIGGTATFTSGPYTNDWWRNATNGTGIINQAAGQGISFDASGAAFYPSGDRVVGATMSQTLTNKMLTNPRNQAAAGFLGANSGDATNFMFNYGNGTFTLPNPSAAWIGVFRAIKSYPGGPSTITCGVAMIGPGGTGPVGSFVIQAGDSVTMWCDGANWWVL
jgi:hypothetical protein